MAVRGGVGAVIVLLGRILGDCVVVGAGIRLEGAISLGVFEPRWLFFLSVIAQTLLKLVAMLTVFLHRRNRVFGRVGASVRPSRSAFVKVVHHQGLML